MSDNDFWKRQKKYVVIDSFNFLLIAAGASLKSTDPDAFQYIAKRMLFKMQDKFPNSFFYACWDSFGGTQFRKDIDKNYKSNRQKQPGIIDIKQLLSMRDFFENRGVINIALEETEADDVIYCLCKRIKEQNPDNDVTILTRDKDMIQVVQQGYADRIYDYTKKNFLEIPWYDIVMYKALVGDQSDCIPGVKGIGDKTAKKLLSEYIVTGKLNLNEEQEKQYEKCLNMVDASRHPRLQENLTKLKELGVL